MTLSRQYFYNVLCNVICTMFLNRNFYGVLKGCFYGIFYDVIECCLYGIFEGLFSGGHSLYGIFYGIISTMIPICIFTVFLWYFVQLFVKALFSQVFFDTKHFIVMLSCVFFPLIFLQRFQIRLSIVIFTTFLRQNGVLQPPRCGDSKSVFDFLVRPMVQEIINNL